MAKADPDPESPKRGPTERIVELLKGTRRRSADTRRDSARLLGRVGGQAGPMMAARATRRLVELSQDRDTGVRGASFTGLGWLGPSIPSDQLANAGNVLLTNFEEPDEELRSRAMSAAARLYPMLPDDQRASIVRLLLRALHSTDVGTWIPPLRALPELGRRLSSEDFSRFLRDLFAGTPAADGGHPPAWHAVDVLLKSVPSRDVPWLVSQAILETESKDDRRRNSGYQALRRLLYHVEAPAFEASLRRFLQALEDPSSEVRANTGAGLANLVERLPPDRQRVVLDDLVKRMKAGRIEASELAGVARCAENASPMARSAFVDIALAESRHERPLNAINGWIALHKLATVDPKSFDAQGREQLFDDLARPERSGWALGVLMHGNLCPTEDEMYRIERLLLEAFRVEDRYNRSWLMHNASEIRKRRLRRKNQPSPDWNGDGNGLAILFR